MLKMKLLKFLRLSAWALAGLLGLMQTAHAVLPIQHWQQPGGARVYLVESHNIPMVDVQIDLDAGSRRDPPDKPGLASAAAGQLASGIRAQPGLHGPYAKALDENRLGEAWPIQTIADLVQRARNPANRVTYASGGVGSPQHLASEMFKAFAGVDLTHIPFRGASQATLAVASGEVDLMSMALSLAQPFLQDGKVRLIGYCGPQRHAQFRDIPTLQEQGVKGYDYSSWIGLFFHKDVPSEVGAVLAREALAIGEDREFQVQLIRSGLEPWSKSAQELGRIVREDFARWKSIIEQAKIQA